MNPPLLKKFELILVGLVIAWLNWVLKINNRILFGSKKVDPQRILIYKIGNIGDIVCAVPAFIAIRRNYLRAKIALLTSPGWSDAPGAKELLVGAWYIDELRVYFSEEVKSSIEKRKFIRNLRMQKYDLFIQIPDDLVNFRTLFRNMIFAKMIGAKSAVGFRIRTIQLFKRTQVDYSSQKTEVESLLDLLTHYGIKSQKTEFDFNIPKKEKKKVDSLLRKKWGRTKKGDIVVAISPGGKRDSNRWPQKRFRKVAEYLGDKYGAKIVILGGRDDIPLAKVIGLNLRGALVAAGRLSFLGTFELLRHCSFLISNSTGTIHLAAAGGIRAIGIYGVRDVFGRWFPYGAKHKILYHKFLDCDYRNEECIKRSIEMVRVEEVIVACNQFLGRKY